MSSTNPDPKGDAVRRKFDDIASLFGPIVPPAGTQVRPCEPAHNASLPQVPDSELDNGPTPQLAPPPKLRAPATETLQTRPAAEPLRLPTAAPVIKAPLVPAPSPARLRQAEPEVTRPEPAKSRVRKREDRPDKSAGSDRKAEVPWPDAFAPRPNYKVAYRSRWLFWLFLIPLAVVVAVAITFVDPRVIRSFVDQALPQYLPAEVVHLFGRGTASPAKPTSFPPLLPLPAGPPGSAVAPSGTTLPPMPQPPTPEPPALPAAPPPASLPPPAAAPDPPAAPVPPVRPEPSVPLAQAQTAAPDAQPTPLTSPPPPSAAIEPPAAAPIQIGSEPAATAVPPPSPGTAASAANRVTIYYRRNQTSSEGEARRVAAKVGNAEIKASPSTSRSPMIYYFNPADRDTATSLARSLAGEGAAGWIVRAGPTRQSVGAIDILLP